MTTDEYLSDTEESHRRRQLTMGVLSEPPVPFYGHQCVLLTTARLMADLVEQEWLGRIAIAPLDVILDHERNLVVQPDILFIAAGRGRIIRNQVWGPPDLVVEVLSLSTERHDRGEKLEWYPALRCAGVLARGRGSPGSHRDGLHRRPSSRTHRGRRLADRLRRAAGIRDPGEPIVRVNAHRPIRRCT